MSSPAARRVAALVTGGPIALLALLVATASPAAAHSVGGALPAPSWLLGYGSVAVIALVAVALRTSWPSPRLSRFHPDPEVPGPTPAPLLTGLVGVTALVLVIVTALVGLNSQAANPAPTLVGAVFWVGLPLVCVLLGDVYHWVNPFVTVLRILDRRPAVPADDDDRTDPPVWVPAAFLFSFTWFLLAYYRPGSPRALATYLLLYAVAALGLGVRWGHRWLATGEGFGALSAAVARLSPRGARGPLPRGIAPLMVVWLGGVAFDVVAESTFWIDVLGSSRGWGRTLLDTVGLVWMTAIVAALYLVVLQVAQRNQEQRLGGVLGVALVPLAAGWFLAHDLSFLLVEGQNAYILLSDPFAEGWDLFGTIGYTPDYGFLQDRWLSWTQLGLLVAGHVAAVVVLHDAALTVLRRRAAVSATGAMAVVTSASVAAGIFLVLR